MGKMGIRMEAVLYAIAACAVLMLLALPVFATNGMPADTEQIFGVGARADAMGDAFVALANDPTAAFWNPAGLSFLRNAELTAVTKSLPKVMQATSIQPADFGPFAGWDSNTVSNMMSGSTSAGEATFLSVTAPIGKHPAKHGTIGISRSLAGFIDRQWTISQAFDPIDPGTVDTMTTSVRDRLRIDYNSLTYGWTPSETLAAGLGVVQAEVNAYTIGTTEQTFMQPGPEPFQGTIGPSSTTGKGYGCIVGALWTPKSFRSGALTVGGSYLTKMALHSFNSSSFGDERPDRLLLGANYRQGVPARDGHVQWSFQLSHNGSANDHDGTQLVRNAVWNTYFGGEYGIHRDAMDYALRYGLFTNRTPNDSVYGSETWLTLGLGAGHVKDNWQAEFALQSGLRTGMSLISISGGCSF